MITLRVLGYDGVDGDDVLGRVFERSSGAEARFPYSGGKEGLQRAAINYLSSVGIRVNYQSKLNGIITLYTLDLTEPLEKPKPIVINVETEREREKIIDYLDSYGIFDID